MLLLLLLVMMMTTIMTLHSGNLVATELLQATTGAEKLADSFRHEILTIC
jgi:hypothetical protein